jgi:two-component system LytT family response regulator
MNILIIEDEIPAAKRLEKLLLEHQPKAQILAKLDSIEASINWFQSHIMPDIVFMDIELADGQSFEIFNKINISAPVVFTTAYDEFALKAFQVNSIDYLLKPIDITALANTFEKLDVLKKSASKHVTQSPDIDKLIKSFMLGNYKSRFLVKMGERLFTIETPKIAYFISEEKLTFMITDDNKKYVIDQTLDEVEKSLDPKMFFRLNRQIIASLKSISNIHTHFNGKLKIILKPEHKEEVLVSREKASFFKEWLDY